MSQVHDRSFRKDAQHDSSANTATFDQQTAHAASHTVEAQQAAGAAAVKRMAGDPVPPGTEVWVHRSLGYHHAGVYVGNGEVVQVHAEPVHAAEQVALHGHCNALVDKVSLSAFAKGGTVIQGPTHPTFSHDQIIQRALSHVGQTWKYNLLNHNCQHFASEVVSGHADSAEKDRFFAILQQVENRAGGLAGGAKELAGEAGQVAQNAGKAVGGFLHHLHL